MIFSILEERLKILSIQFCQLSSQGMLWLRGMYQCHQRFYNYRKIITHCNDIPKLSVVLGYKFRGVRD